MPTVDQSENRPPTQGQNSKIRSSAYPCRFASSGFAVIATTCTVDAASPATVPNRSSSQRCAARALLMVSSVVNVFDVTRKSVVAGFKSSNTSVNCAPSTLETKCMRGPSAKRVNAAHANRGPSDEPPMPMATTSVNACSVTVRMRPLRMPSTNARIFCS